MDLIGEFWGLIATGAFGGYAYGGWRFAPMFARRHYLWERAEHSFKSHEEVKREAAWVGFNSSLIWPVLAVVHRIGEVATRPEVEALAEKEREKERKRNREIIEADERRERQRVDDELALAEKADRKRKALETPGKRAFEREVADVTDQIAVSHYEEWANIQNLDILRKMRERAFVMDSWERAEAIRRRIIQLKESGQYF